MHISPPFKSIRLWLKLIVDFPDLFVWIRDGEEKEEEKEDEKSVREREKLTCDGGYSAARI